MFLLYMSMARGHVSELWPPTGLLFITQVKYEYHELRWNDIGSGNPKKSEKTLCQCHFVHNKSHMDWPGVETRLPRWQLATNRLSHGKAFQRCLCIHYQCDCYWRDPQESATQPYAKSHKSVHTHTGTLFIKTHLNKLLTSLQTLVFQVSRIKCISFSFFTSVQHGPPI
jgi:hypothetical protein